jgi:hypothetical protein
LRSSRCEQIIESGLTVDNAAEIYAVAVTLGAR